MSYARRASSALRARLIVTIGASPVRFPSEPERNPAWQIGTLPWSAMSAAMIWPDTGIDAFTSADRP
jgi:hypothetical protein